MNKVRESKSGFTALWWLPPQLVSIRQEVVEAPDSPKPARLPSHHHRPLARKCPASTATSPGHNNSYQLYSYLSPCGSSPSSKVPNEQLLQPTVLVGYLPSSEESSQQYGKLLHEASTLCPEYLLTKPTHRLGADEDAFLLGCNQLYGPVVYLPWPLGQYLVTDGPTIQRVYETSSKTLSFVRPRPSSCPAPGPRFAAA